MKYMGSKRRIAKEILPIILKNRKDGQTYVEPFCGGCNSLDKVTGNRIGNDINRYLIALLNEMKKEDFSLPFVGEEEYKNMKNSQSNYPDWLLGYVGLQLSFGAKWFGGYRRDKKGVSGIENETFQNNQARNSILKQSKLLTDVAFYCKNYYELEIPNESIIYCDPPYQGTTEYKDGFDHKKFWSWCEEMVKCGHKVFVSEYNAPQNWKSIWEKAVVTGLDVSSTKKDIEKLFVLSE
jgi:DNA adenine methylase